MVNWHLYNLSGMQSVNTTTSNAMLVFLRETSAQTNYMPGLMILASLWLVLFFALRMKGNGASVSFAASSWACCFVAILLYPLQILSSQVFIIFISLVPVSALLLWLTGGD